LGIHELHGDLTLKEEVRRPSDGTHAALSEQLLHAILPVQDVAGRGIRSGGLGSVHRHSAKGEAPQTRIVALRSERQVRLESSK
jgi:hypothetical protein